MRKLFCILFLVVVSSAAVMAQDAPKTEVFGGYSYLRTDAGLSTDKANLNGWNASATRYFTKNLGLTADFSGAYGSPSEFSKVDTSAHNFLFGPTVAVRSQKLTGFAHALFGVSHLHFGSGVDYSDNAFGMALGGGVDANLSRHVAVRVAQVDYLYTNFNSANQNNFRYSGGLVVRF